MALTCRPWLPWPRSGGADQAVLATLIYRLASYWLPMPTGAVAYALFRHRYGSTKVARLNGGDPTASDTLIVNGTAGDDAMALNLVAGTLTGLTNTVTFSNIEQLTIHGQGAAAADTLTTTTPAAACGWWTRS